MNVDDQPPVITHEPRPPVFRSEAALTIGVLALILVIVGAGLWMLPESRRLSTDAAQARQHVIEIVNRPVNHWPRSQQAGVFSPGWFHPGAVKQDFNTVDVRATQQFPYDTYSYVTSDLNPSEMFAGRDLEFNTMTKAFYLDRTLPKRRLSEAEMLEINRLYRIIGQAERASALRWTILAGLAVTLFGLVAVTRFLFPPPG